MMLRQDVARGIGRIYFFRVDGPPGDDSVLLENEPEPFYVELGGPARILSNPAQRLLPRRFIDLGRSPLHDARVQLFELLFHRPPVSGRARIVSRVETDSSDRVEKREFADLPGVADRPRKHHSVLDNEYDQDLEQDPAPSNSCDDHSQEPDG